MARQRGLCSSLTLRNLSLRSSAVASNWKSMATPGIDAQPGDAAPSHRLAWPLALPGNGPLQVLLPPESLHTIVVHVSALSPEQAISHTPAPAGVLNCDLAETMLQFSVLDRDGLGWMALGAAVVKYHTADQPLRCPVRFLQNRDGTTVAFRAHKFPSARSLSSAFSSSASARSFLRRAFSFSSWDSRLASSAFTPPYCCRQRW